MDDKCRCGHTDKQHVELHGEREGFPACLYCATWVCYPDDFYPKWNGYQYVTTRVGE